MARPPRWPAGESRPGRYSGQPAEAKTPRYLGAYPAGSGGSGERTPISMPHQLLQSLTEQDEEVDLRDALNRSGAT